MLIDLSAGNNLGGGGSSGSGGFQYPPQPAGFIGYPPAPTLPQQTPTAAPFVYPGTSASGGDVAASYAAGEASSSASPSAPPPFNYNILPIAASSSSMPSLADGANETKDLNTNTVFIRVRK